MEVGGDGVDGDGVEGLCGARGEGGKGEGRVGVGGGRKAGPLELFENGETFQKESL